MAVAQYLLIFGKHNANQRIGWVYPISLVIYQAEVQCKSKIFSQVMNFMGYDHFIENVLKQVQKTLVNFETFYWHNGLQENGGAVPRVYQKCNILRFWWCIEKSF